MAFLTFKNLHFRHGTWRLAIDATIERNSCTAIIGPSGAGKSTLLSLISGFEHPERGVILINGEDITALAPALPVPAEFQDPSVVWPLAQMPQPAAQAVPVPAPEAAPHAPGVVMLAPPPASVPSAPLLPPSAATLGAAAFAVKAESEIP